MKVELISLTPAAARVIEEAGRTCYMSFENMGPGSAGEFIRRIIRAGHLSVLEHASAGFRLSGVSRSCTHQLVRHRLCSFSQRSQRYVSEKGFKYVEPGSVSVSSEASGLYRKTMERISEAYSELVKMGIPREEARYLLPNGCRTEIVLTANFRQLRHMIELRGGPRAQREIREVFIEILRILREKVPECFCDFSIDEEEKVIRRKGDE